MAVRIPNLLGLVVVGHFLHDLSEALSAIPAPIAISPSQYWEGNDGPWSTFTLQVGTPAQNVRVLISTAGFTSWVVLPEACTSTEPSNCVDARGEVFNRDTSSTWKFNDYYDLVLESNLNYTGSGAFGLDKVGIGWQGDGSPILDNQVVAGIITEDFWLGSFGLNPRPTNLSDFNDPQPSFLQTLKNRGLVPSLSWSYTAGAPYRLNKVLGSLIFGGYDVSKFGSTNLSFDFGPDISRDLTVGLQAITMEEADKAIELLPNGIFSFIDSTVPQIWLPQIACEQFEKALGITWNETANLYLLNDTQHSSLLSRNATFTFKIGNTTKDGQTINIVLPYASFDLAVDYPHVSNRTRYFPIMRAANDSQYTLGRTFLQEAYLTADYERSRFNLSQTRFDPGANPHIEAILSPNTTAFPHPDPEKSLSRAAIGGIAAGSILALALAASLLFYLIRRHRSIHNKNAYTTQTPLETTQGFQKAELDAGETMKAREGHEMEGRAVEFFQPDKTGAELDSRVASPVVESGGLVVGEPVFEMVGDAPVVGELDAASHGVGVGGDVV